MNKYATEYEKDLNEMKEQILKESNTLLTKRDLLERFCEIDKEYKGRPWNLLQILANINILIGEEPCEDCISRQAVLAIAGDSCYKDTREFCDEIKELPPVQPEIIRCKDCKHWTNNIGDSELRDNYCNEKTHGFYYRCSGDDYCSFAERINDGRFNKQTGCD
jgi:hypothetical protein